MSADTQLNDDLLGEIGRYWPARALGLTCKRLGHLLDIASHIIKRTEVDEWGTIVTARRLPDGRLHGESTVAYDDGVIRRITSYLGVSTVCTSTSRAVNSHVPYARRSIYRGNEYVWQFGMLITISTDGYPCTEIAECTFDECDAEIATYALNRPHGDVVALDVASYSPCFDIPPDLVRT